MIGSVRCLLVGTVLLAAGAHADEAIFAGGCFWCVEALYQETEGVTDAVSGFTGGTYPNPTYNGRHDGHYESVRVTYDPDKISYHALLDLFWVNIDPFDPDGQFCDKGPSYRSAIFVADDTQRKLAEASKAKVAAEFPTRRTRSGTASIARAAAATDGWKPSGATGPTIERMQPNS
jgi:peptide-methionine (S)-S-oxide reductase